MVEAGGMAYVRTVKTSSGATAVQIVWKYRRGARSIEHLGSAHSQGEVELLRAVGAQRVAAGQDVLPGVEAPVQAEPLALEIVSTRMGRLLDALDEAYRQIGLDRGAGGDKVFQDLVTARLIEPSSKQDTGRVLREAGIRPLSYRTVKRRLRVYGDPAWRARLSDVLAGHARLGPAALVLYDVTTLWFETDGGDGFREPGFSKERRLEPQVTVGLLTDAAGFPLMVDAFEGNKAETTTMIPLIRRFVAAHGIGSVTVVADAGMMSKTNLADIEQVGWSFIVGGRVPDVPYQVSKWLADHPGERPPDGLTLTQPAPSAPGAPSRWLVHYQYRDGRARRSTHGIDQQIRKAEKTVAGQTPVKRTRFVKIAGAAKTVDRELEIKTRALAGWKSYVTNLDWPPGDVIGAYHQLWHVEHAFRMSKHDLRARPVYHHTRQSIDAHLAIVMAALAVATRIEQATGWTIKRFIKTLRQYRAVVINTGTQHVTAEQPLPEDARQALTRLSRIAH
jgi:hypothetical protein